jgi:hypothetical protein
MVRERNDSRSESRGSDKSIRKQNIVDRKRMAFSEWFSWEKRSRHDLGVFLICDVVLLHNPKVDKKQNRVKPYVGLLLKSMKKRECVKWY